MPHLYYMLLVLLSEAPQRRMRMTDLAERAKITRSRLSHAISRLEKDGWLRREDCPTDRRGQIAMLTEEGLAVLEKAAPGHVEAVRSAVFGRLNDDQVRALGEIMRVVAEGLAPRTGAAADVPWLR
jgi:DNA-binding MarR family transcriptional regulator